MSVAAVALRWTLERPGVAAAMVGTFHGGHLEDDLAALELRLDEEDRGRIAGALAGLDDLRACVRSNPNHLRARQALTILDR